MLHKHQAIKSKAVTRIIRVYKILTLNYQSITTGRKAFVLITVIFLSQIRERQVIAVVIIIP